MQLLPPRLALMCLRPPGAQTHSASVFLTRGTHVLAVRVRSKGEKPAFAISVGPDDKQVC
jgi:hypothetical protein